ncbi:MAG: 7TM diverse intracellular signaling domain-containing protein [Owenweeksia sp.]
MNSNLGRLLLVLLLINVKLSGKQPEIGQTTSLHQQVEIVNLGDKDLELEDLLKQEDTLHFEPLPSENENTGFTTDHYWLRFSLENKGEQTRHYYLETARPITDLADLYQVDKAGRVKLMRSGDRIPFAQRPLPNRATIFPLELPAGTTYRYYLHLGSDGEVINLQLKLHSSVSLVNEIYVEHIFFGFFYGFIILAAVIYLFFYTGLREKTFLYYGLYVLSIGLLQLSLDGLTYQYLFPGGGWLSARMVMIGAFASIFFLGRYAESFLRLREHFRIIPLIFRAIYILSGIMLAGLFLSPLVFEFSYPAGNLLGLLELLLIIGSLILLYIRKVRVDPFFTIGIGFLATGLTIFILNNLNVIPNTFLTAHSTKLGAGLEVLFLSLSMTNLIGKLREDKEKSQELALLRLKEVNTLKNNFMSNISHELRTPLNLIMGVADQLVDTAADPDTRKEVEMIQSASFSLLSSVNDILDYSKIEKQQLVLTQTEFSPAELLVKLSRNWRMQASQKNIQFNFELGPSLPEVCLGDPERLAQIAGNLVGNAIKFSAAGSVSIELSGAYPHPAAFNLIMSVKDTGVGISPKKLNTIFESFNQQQMGNKRQFGGLGLGLSIVKRLVDLHKGRIEIHSSKGEGTYCRVEIPYAVLPQKELESHHFSKDEQDLQGHPVLVVEDNPLNQFIMRKILSDWQNTPFKVVENGEEALEELQKETYHLIFMDLQMPVMDGYEATIAIRKGEAGAKNARIPIIAVTADVTEETRQKVKELGFNKYLSKPVSSEELYEAAAYELSKTS